MAARTLARRREQRVEKETQAVAAAMRGAARSTCPRRIAWITSANCVRQHVTAVVNREFPGGGAVGEWRSADSAGAGYRPDWHLAKTPDPAHSP